MEVSRCVLGVKSITEQEGFTCFCLFQRTNISTLWLKSPLHISDKLTKIKNILQRNGEPQNVWMWRSNKILFNCLLRNKDNTSFAFRNLEITVSSAWIDLLVKLGFMWVHRSFWVRAFSILNTHGLSTLFLSTLIMLYFLKSSLFSLNLWKYFRNKTYLKK